MASLTYELTLAGMAVGSAAALTGIGLIVTYRATGVLNLAHGAIAMICAYVLRQLVVEWSWPLAPAALVTLLLFAPALGLLLDRAVFRPLALSGSNPAQTLVASIGVFVLLVGVAALIWGTGARADAPVLLGDDPWVQLAVVVALACLVGAVTRWTRFGRELRAVVDNRPLATLSGIAADRVSAAGWAFGSFTAGLTGVLLAPYVRLDPYGMPLLVVEVIAVAVVARMRSLPVAVLTGLALGVAQAQLTRLHPEGWAGPLVQAVGANLFVVALLVAALVLPGVGGGDTLPPTPAGGRTPPGLWPAAGVLLLLPLAFGGTDLTTAVQVPALAVILLSLVVVSGRAGQIALGQTAYAGLGALFAALLAAAGLPELVALGTAVLCVAPLGLLTGWPAIRRHGLALALATLAVGVAVSRFVLTQPYATAGLTVSRPAAFADDRAYYALELLLLAACLLLVAALRRGRTGRALAALRDHEPGAEAAGVRVAGLKLLAFVLGAALAALGGGLLTMGQRAFDPDTYDPIQGLLWFATILILGPDTLLTPLVAAALLTTLDTSTHAGAAAATIGILATLVGRLPPLLGRLGRGVGRGDGAPIRAGGMPSTTPHRPAAADGASPPTGRPAPLSPRRTGGAGGNPGPAGGRAQPHRPAAAGETVPAAPTERPALHADRLTLTYPGGLTALHTVTLTLRPAQITALVGPNGAGKSTLFDCLAGTLRPTAGRVVLGRTDITGRSAHARARMGIGRTFQQLAVFPSLTVEENVRVGAEQGRPASPGAVEQALRLVGLAGPVRHRAAAGLPTGTLRRVELARALAAGPHTLLLDEPAAGLDTDEAAELAKILAALAADGLTVLVVEHDPDLVAGLARTVHTMEGGRIVS
ncbi:ATP-binding cassette domain-containing protein [Streptomyces sp. 2RAF24]|uniref:ABC transporter permease subunit n=1 Tax=Streptomyces sp. 2RAF24 TaxID=3232997 RepID=UPI003F9671AE